MSANEPKRVALLARAGRAREQLRTALCEASAEIVLEDDPNAVDARMLGDAAPQVVLVALEPAIEDALGRLDDILHDPSIAVIFDEAELAARREGWEAQRWARHLAAKLHGHQDVLPPGREEDVTALLEPGLPPTPAQLHADDRLAPYLEEAADVALDLPSDDFAYTGPVVNREFEEVVDADAWLRAAAPAPEPAPVVREKLTLSLAALDSDPFDPPPPPPVFPPRAEPPPLPSFDKLELETLEPVAPAGRSHGAVVVFAGIGGPDAVRKLLAELPVGFARPVLVQLRLDGGRYDNLVRQMSRVAQMPVLLAEAGHSAEPGQVYVMPAGLGLLAQNGNIHFHDDGGADGGALIAALPPEHSAVLLLSGADVALVEPTLKLAARGALVQGQSIDGCYDPAAARAIAAQGAALGSPAELATALLQRW